MHGREKAAEKRHEVSEEELSAVLGEIKTRISALLGTRLERMLLYGSRARGDYEPESDIDIAIIVKEFDRKLKDEILETIAEVELAYLTPVSALVLSQQTFTSLLRRERRIALDIEREGIPI
jgi:predicted nucleotidyltransferase